MPELINLINTESVKDYLTKISTQTSVPQVQQWLLSKKLQRDIGSRIENLKIVEDLPKNLPPSQSWAIEAFNQGKKLHAFVENNELMQLIEHVIDWLEWLVETSDLSLDQNNINYTKQNQIKLEAIKILNGFEQNKFSFKDAVIGSNTWSSKIAEYDLIFNPGIQNTLGEDAEQTVFTYEAYTFKQLKTRESLVIEGKEMDHCVGSYARDVLNGKKKIYSLRDAANKPHATIEVLAGQLTQIKGKTAVPVPKYRDAVIAFFNHINVKANDFLPDIQNMGIIHDKNKFGTFAQLAKLAYQEGTFKVHVNKERFEAFDTRIGTIFNNFALWRGETINKELSIDQRLMLSAYVANAFNALKLQHFYNDSAATDSILDDFSLILDPIDNIVKPISPSLMTKVFQYNDIVFSQRGQRVYIGANDRYLPAMYYNGAWLSKLNPGLYKFRDAIKHYINGHIDKIDATNSYGFKVTESTGFVKAGNKYNDITHVGKQLVQGRQAIWQLGHDYYATDNNRPVALLTSDGYTFNNILGCSDRYGANIPDRITSVLYDFISKSKLSITSTIQAYFEQRALVLNTAAHNAALLVESNALLNTKDAMVFTIFKENRGAAFIVKSKNDKSFFEFSIFQDHIIAMEASPTISSLVPTIVQYLNARHVKRMPRNETESKLKLASFGISYDQVNRCWFQIEYTTAKTNTLKFFDYQVVKKQLLVGKRGGQEVTYTILKDNKNVATIYTELRTLRKSIYDIVYVDRPVGIKYVAKFLNEKATSEDITARNNAWPKFGLLKNHNGIVPSNQNIYVAQYKKGEIVLPNGNIWRKRNPKYWSLYPLNSSLKVLDAAIVDDILVKTEVDNDTLLTKQQKKDRYKDLYMLASILDKLL